MTTDKCDELAARAERGQLIVKPGTIRRGAVAAAEARSALMAATGAATPQEAVQLAMGRPPVGAKSGPSPVVRVYPRRSKIACTTSRSANSATNPTSCAPLSLSTWRCERLPDRCSHRVIEAAQLGNSSGVVVGGLAETLRPVPFAGPEVSPGVQLGSFTSFAARCRSPMA